MRILLGLLAVATLALGAFVAVFTLQPPPRIRLTGGVTYQGPPNPTPEEFRAFHHAVMKREELPPGWRFVRDEGTVEFGNGKITIRAPASDLVSATVYACGIPLQTATRANGRIVDDGDASIATLHSRIPFALFGRVEWVAEDGFVRSSSVGLCNPFASRKRD